MSDYLTPQEQSTAIQLMYLRQYFPADYAALVRSNKTLGDAAQEMFILSGTMANDDIGRFKLKKKFKKLLKAVKKINPVYIASRVLPKPVRNKLVRFEHKHRSEIKKIAAGVAILSGGFLFAPSIMAAGSTALHGGSAMLAKLGALGKGAVASAVEKMRGHLPPEIMDAVDQEVAKIPNGAQIADKLGQEISDKISTIGADKVQAIINRYTNNGQNPFTGPNDPRLAAAVTEVSGVDPDAIRTQNPDNVGINAAVTGSVLQDAQTLRQPGINPLMLAVPAALFLL